MLTFLPALILLLLHGPAPLEGRLALPGERADVGARLPSAVPAVALSSRAFLTELLRKFPGATILAALADESEPGIECVTQAIRLQVAEPPSTNFATPPATTERDRDGPPFAIA